MKPRKTYQATLHDLRDIDPAKFAHPGNSDSFTASGASFNTDKASTVPCGIGVQTTSQATPE